MKKIKLLFKKFRNYGNDCTLGFGKELFLSLLIFLLIRLGSFCNAGEITYTGKVNYSTISSYRYPFSLPIPKITNNSKDFYLTCIFSNYSATTLPSLNIRYYYVDNVPQLSSLSIVNINADILNNGSFTYNFNNINSNHNPLAVFLQTTSNGENLSFDWECVFTGNDIIDNGGTCDYSDYVPVSDYNTCLSDLNTATGNYLSCQSSISGYVNSLNNCSSNLNSCNTSLSSCLSANCPNNTGNISWSALFINNIQHIGAPVIRMTIPEELSWDYAYTDSGNNMEIDIEGYNVDYDKINNIVDIQSYKPTDEDFSNIIGLLADYMPILIIFVGLIFIYKFLTKSFKSKL